MGPDRLDYYVSRLLMDMGAPYPRGEAPKLIDFRMPWQPEPRGSDIDDDDEE